MKLPRKIEDKINEYYKTCMVRHYYHLKAAEKYQMLYVYTTMPIIIFSSITTVLASYSSSIISPELSIAVAIFSGLTTIGQALASFVEYNTKHTLHFSISNKFKSLSYMIESEIAVNYLAAADASDDRACETAEYITALLQKIHIEFTNIQEIEPYLPMLLAPDKYIELINWTECVPLIYNDSDTTIRME